MEIAMFLGPLAGAAPALVFWIAVVVFAAVSLRRGGGRAERFLVAGAGLKLIVALLNIPAVFLVPWLIGEGYSIVGASSIASGYGIFLNVVSMAGIICLIYAFWVKFQARNIETVEDITARN